MTSQPEFHARWRCGTAQDGRSRLIVLLHGRGSDENEIFPLAEYLPESAAVAALRAPLAEGPGFAWFENRGVGRPAAASLAATVAFVERWLDQEAGDFEEAWLVGFSGGAAMAGALLLHDPERFAGAAALHGTFPFEAGMPVVPGRLSGIPVLYGRGRNDFVIPRELIERTRSYLADSSGAELSDREYASGHELDAQELDDLSRWFTERFRATAAAPHR
ncbi:MAG: alpha/beta hydrolase [Vulcanimicrobiaceae bacterium]